ncbi:EAL domain-containing protein [Rhodopirellula sp. JC740]|uniref:EAL domain-containing protein n=1 Tax=Rhodopirellula halodulae TaxID=2894198 RepID=A0ABS8NN38_9BACT|nr:EAL domain-containing protein [Rhodopirellula sp. JC740]MCC9645004.1 EAL domain-containing protein [Rhodopirellula sp. JC740]
MNDVNQDVAQSFTWTLREYGAGQQQRRTLKVPAGGGIVGRSDEADLCIPVTAISKRHAKLWAENGILCVEDLGSTNGTHHNGIRVQTARLHEGDLIQFANAVFRVGQVEESRNDGTLQEGLIPWAQTLLTFEKLLSERAVIPHFQPIVTMDRQSTSGYEVLARSNLPELQNPAKMFHVAERLGQNAALSELMREEAARLLCEAQHFDAVVYVNTHPDEFGTDRLTTSLENLAAAFPMLKFMIEIHEGAVTELAEMRKLQSTIRSLGMQLSYDDFGAGQGRLMELVEVPPDVLKFDMQLIRDIDQASACRIDLLRSLVRIAKDAGSITLAEGVETEAEHEVCVDLGFELGQGFLYGRPSPAPPSMPSAN